MQDKKADGGMQLHPMGIVRISGGVTDLAQKRIEIDWSIAGHEDMRSEREGLYREKLG